MRNFACVFSFLCLLVLNSGNLFAESNKNKELLSLLDSYPEQSSNAVAIYNIKTKTKIADIVIGDALVQVDQSYQSKISNEWSKVTIAKKVIPVWVSDRFVRQNANQVQVNVDRLNARLSPSIESEKITVLTRGYSSPRLDSQNGFVKIYLAEQTPVLILTKRLKEIASNISYESTIAENRQPPNSYLANTSKIEPSKQAKVINNQGSSSSIVLPVATSISDKSNSILEGHIIAPGDSISLFVFGETDLSKENIRVPENGRVALPLIGLVEVAGKTTRQVEEDVRSILASGYVNNPQASVSIFSYRPIFIRGAVESTGAFPYTEGLSVAKALALAGGALNSAKIEGVSVLRNGKKVKAGLGLDSQYQISSGDVITVEEEQGVRGDESLFIYLHGEVVSPGEYRYRKGLTVEKAIVLSGGFTLRASRRKVSITRYINVEENEAPEELKNVKLYTIIMPGDVIKVRASLF